MRVKEKESTLINNAALVLSGKKPNTMLKRYVKARKKLGRWRQESREKLGIGV